MKDEILKAATEVVDSIEGDSGQFKEALIRLARALGRDNVASRISFMIPVARVRELINTHRSCPKCGCSIDSGGFCTACEYRVSVTLHLDESETS